MRNGPIYLSTKGRTGLHLETHAKPHAPLPIDMSSSGSNRENLAVRRRRLKMSGRTIVQFIPRTQTCSARDSEFSFTRPLISARSSQREPQSMSSSSTNIGILCSPNLSRSASGKLAGYQITTGSTTQSASTAFYSVTKTTVSWS